MIASEKKTHQNLSDYNQFLFTKRFEVIKKQIFPSEEMRNSGNCNYDDAHSLIRFLIQLAIASGYNIYTCVCELANHPQLR